jgi:hypothetical protein
MRFEDKQEKTKVKNNHEGLVRIVPRQCEIFDLIDGEEVVQCSHPACWQYDGTAVCLPDIKAMARMNSDNEEVFALALAGDWLVTLEKKYIELAKQEVEARQRQGLPLTPEWLDALERKHNALAQLEIAAVEMEQQDREGKGSHS